MALDALEDNTELPKDQRASLRSPAALHGHLQSFDLEGALSKIASLEALVRAGTTTSPPVVRGKPGSVKCPNCGGAHTRKKCPLKCVVCDRPGHKAADCRVRCFTCGGRHKAGDARCPGASKRPAVAEQREMSQAGR